MNLVEGFDGDSSFCHQQQAANKVAKDTLLGKQCNFGLNITC